MPMPSLRSSLTLRILPKRTTTATTAYRCFSTTMPRPAGGDTGAMRRGGEAHADTWTRREKAAEDFYIREHEKTIMVQLKAKIAAQEEILARDRAILSAMEDQYGHVVEER